MAVLCIQNGVFHSLPISFRLILVYTNCLSVFYLFSRRFYILDYWDFMIFFFFISIYSYNIPAIINLILMGSKKYSHLFFIFLIIMKSHAWRVLYYLYYRYYLYTLYLLSVLLFFIKLKYISFIFIHTNIRLFNK